MTQPGEFLCGDRRVALVTRGPAVIGHDPVQYLAWKPCCREPVRLDGTAFERSLPVVVLCDRPRCKRLWTVEFPRTPPGQEAVAVWRLQRCR